MKLIEEMKSLGVKPNIRTYNTFLRGCLRTGDIKNAKIIFSEMNQAKKDSKKSSKGAEKAEKSDNMEKGESIAPDQYTLDSYVKILALFGELVLFST